MQIFSPLHEKTLPLECLENKTLVKLNENKHEKQPHREIQICNPNKIIEDLIVAQSASFLVPPNYTIMFHSHTITRNEIILIIIPYKLGIQTI
jgi:hypothetical protein